MRKSRVSTNLILNVIKGFGKLYIYSTSLHQDFYQKVINCFSIFMSMKIIQDTLNEADLDLIFKNS